MADELGRQLAIARARPGFLERLERRIREDKPILDRLHEKPCPAMEVAVLGLDVPSPIRCGLTEGHRGLHSFYMEWSSE